MSYKKSGVDRGKADRLVTSIAKMAGKSQGSLGSIAGSIGGYAALYDLGGGNVLATTTDGVGTKLKLAFELGLHHTVGIDLVAMSVNDLICVGARPIQFLDYYATSKLDTQVAKKVISGIVKGCKLAGCSLVGGETAELPGMYHDGEYDLAGFATGLLKRKNLLPQSKSIRPGDVLIGIPSSGLHSNGFSLVRSLIKRSDPDSLKKTLLTPTRIYSKPMLPLISNPSRFALKGIAHITGSGFLNVPRISDQVNYEITLPRARPKIFDWVEERSKLSFEELGSTFNLGIGLVLVVGQKHQVTVLRKLAALGAVSLGRVTVKRGSKSNVLLRSAGGKKAILEY